MHKNDVVYIKHILSCIKKIKKYIKDQTKSSFSKNELIHHYMGVDIDVIWATIKQDINPLEKELKKINFILTRKKS